MLREAQAAARLNHRGIVTLYELGRGQPPRLSGQRAGRGRDARRAGRAGRISDRGVAEIGAELCDALDHAHANGVIHRDIKPQNIVVRPADKPLPAGSARAKLMDFGIAQLHDAPKLTRDGRGRRDDRLHGSRAGRGRVDAAAADVYSLALTLYECWSGRNPVARATPAATARAIGEPLPSLGELRPGLPAELCARSTPASIPTPSSAPPSRARRRARRDRGAARRPPAGPGGAPRPRGPRSSCAARSRCRARRDLGVRPLHRPSSRAAPEPRSSRPRWLAPIPLLLDRPLQWAPRPRAGSRRPRARAALSRARRAGTDRRRRFALGMLGFAWLAVAESGSGGTLLFASLDPAGAGWSGSAASAAQDVLAAAARPGAAAGGAGLGRGRGAARLAAPRARRRPRAARRARLGRGLVAVHCVSGRRGRGARRRRWRSERWASRCSSRGRRGDRWRPAAVCEAVSAQDWPSQGPAGRLGARRGPPERDRSQGGTDQRSAQSRSRIEGLVEGVFSRAFSSQVQPVELARKLAKEMDAHRTASVSRVYVPNQYTVFLSPDDHQRLEGYERSLAQELSATCSSTPGATTTRC